MSDDTPPPPRPPQPPKKPTTKTSTVPLKKETVRITLRAKPGEGVTEPADETAAAPPPPGVASPPPAPPAPPAAQTGGAETLHKTQKVTVTAPGAAAGAGAAAAAGAAAVGAPTVKLDKTPAAPAAPGATQELPRATVQLQRTQPLAGTPGASTGPAASQPLQGTTTTQLRSSASAGPSKMLLPLSILCGLLSLGVLGLAFLATDEFFPGDPIKNKAQEVGFLIPKAENPTHRIPDVEVDGSPNPGEIQGVEELSPTPATPAPAEGGAEPAPAGDVPVEDAVPAGGTEPAL